MIDCKAIILIIKINAVINTNTFHCLLYNVHFFKKPFVLQNYFYIMEKIILASKSPRRKQLLEWAEVPFEIIVSDTDESFPEQLSLNEIPIYIARQKAIAVKKQLQHTNGLNQQLPIILAADTVVVLDNVIIGKPLNKIDAIKILTSLSSKVHKVITGVVILNGDKEIAFEDITIVQFHALTQDQIEYYVDNYRPYDKAGAYAIQEWIGVVGIKSVEGDFYNVMGLPVSRVLKHLEALK